MLLNGGKVDQVSFLPVEVACYNTLLSCSFVIICSLYIFVVVVFFFVADTLYRLCLLCMPSIVVNLIIIIIILLEPSVWTQRWSLSRYIAIACVVEW